MKKLFPSLILYAALLPGVFCRAEEKPAEPPPPQKPENGREFLPPPPPPSQEMMQKKARFRRGPGIWRVFSRLSVQERKELMELQRKDPEKFRQLLQQKADSLFQSEQQERKALNELAKRCRSSKDETEKAELTRQLREKIAKRFQERLKEHRANLEENRRRLAMMEEELDKRTANADAVIDAQLADMLSGRQVKRPQHPQRPPHSAPGVERVSERIP